MQVEGRREKAVRRNDSDRQVDVLRALRDGAFKPTHVMYRANLNWIDTKRFLVALAANGFMILRPDGYRKSGFSDKPDLCYLQIVLTEKGLNLLHDWERVNRVLSA